MLKNNQLYKLTDWIIIFFAFSLFVGAETFFVITREESVVVAIATFKYIFLIAIIQSSLLIITYYLWRYFFYGLFSTFLVFNLFCLKLLFIPSIIQLNENIYWGVLLTLIIGLFFLISYLGEKKYKVTWKVYFTIFIIFGAPALFQYSVNHTDSLKNEIVELDEWRIFNFKNNRPNIYLLSYDSLIPETVATRYLDIKEVEYQRLIDEDFNEIPNTLSFQVPTKPSLNSIMRLDQVSQKMNWNLFVGREPSILSEIFRNNGYKINTGFSTGFFGEKGPYIDEYIRLGLGGVYFENTTLCIDIGDSIKTQSRLLFLCPIYKNIQKLIALNKKNEFYNEVFKILFSEQSLHALSNDWHKQTLSYIKETAQKQQPTLTFFYTYRPIGHTPGGYDHKNFEMRGSYEKYFSEGSRLLAKDLREIIDAIESNDPASIVIVFGDHGAWMSRNTDEKQESEFFYEDRHRILMALMKTNHKCSNPDRIYSKEYATPSRLLLDIFLCLGIDRNSYRKLINFDENERILNKVFSKYTPVK